MRSGRSRDTSPVRQSAVVLLSLALPLAGTMVAADVRFQINHPSTGDPLTGQSVTIVSPAGEESTAVTDGDGEVELAGAEGNGWTARFTVEGRTYTAAGAPVAEADSKVLLGVLTGLGAVAVGAAVTDSNDDDVVQNGSDGGDPGSGGGSGGGGGIGDADSSCTATVNVIEAQLENPGGFLDAPVDGDTIDIGVQGNNTLFFEIDLIDFTVSVALSCGFGSDAGLDNCSGNMLGTFNQQNATIEFTDTSASTTLSGGTRQIQDAQATMTVTASPTSTRRRSSLPATEGVPPCRIFASRWP